MIYQSFNFNKLPAYISFEEELEFVQSYVNIEKARFKDKITVNYELNEIEELQIPPLILQPLVENAIRHGIRKKRESGIVTIRTISKPYCYLIAVEDDGVGMSEEQIKRILENRTINKNGIGLTNVNLRLIELYNTELIIESIIGKGTKVTVTIPKN